MAIAIILLLPAMIYLILCFTAPFGWQDDSGFHYGQDE
jgi:hypothetical protein